MWSCVWSCEVSLRVLPGNFRGVQGAARTFTPVDLWDVEIKTLNKAFELDLTDGHNCIVFVRNGRRRRARVPACAWWHARATWALATVVRIRV